MTPRSTGEDKTLRMSSTRDPNRTPGPPGAGPAASGNAESDILNEYIQILRQEIDEIHRSRSWKLVRVIRGIVLALRQPRRVAALTRRPFIRLQGLQRRAAYSRAFPELSWHAQVNLGRQVDGLFEHHRSGWTYAVRILNTLNGSGGTYLDTAVDQTFAYQRFPSPAHSAPWAGICHVPGDPPEWLPEDLRRQFFRLYSRTPAWWWSAPRCIGLFALSRAHAEELRQWTDLPICTLTHPTEIPALQWSMERFLANRSRKVLQIGWWLRKIHAIFQARFPGYEKVFLQLTGQAHVKRYFEKEEEYLRRLGTFRTEMLETATFLPYVPNRTYDMLLSENVVFLDLYGSSANNAIIECIARGTPILINPLPAVVEYLGPSYPLYYATYEEAAHKASDLDLLQEAHHCLTAPGIRERISAGSFLRAFMSSSIYRDLGREANAGRSDGDAR
jgi:hypothetical protein